MGDLIAFLLAIEDERERKANAAAGKAGEPAWSAGGEFTTELVRTAEEGAPVVDGPWGGLSWEMRQHIADNDPAFVLADVAAKRLLLEDHTSRHTVVDGFCVEEGGPCTHAGEGFCQIDSWEDCRTQRLLALPYAGHPDYREEWKP